MTHNEWIKSRLTDVIETMNKIIEKGDFNYVSDYEAYKQRGVTHEYMMMTKYASKSLHKLALEAYEKAVFIDEQRR